MAIRCIARRPELWFESWDFPPVPPHRQEAATPVASRRAQRDQPTSSLRWAAKWGPARAADFLVEGAQKTMLVLKRLIAFGGRRALTAIAGGGVACRARPALALGDRAAGVGDAGDGRYRLVPRLPAVGHRRHYAVRAGAAGHRHGASSTRAPIRRRRAPRTTRSSRWPGRWCRW